MRVSRTGAVVLAVALGAPLIAKAQDQDRGRWSGVARLDPGTTITVRTNEPIDSSRTDYRVYTATVDRGVRGDNGDLAIPRGATAELIVRSARDNDLILDLESVTIGGHRYAVRTDRQRVDSGNNNLIGQIGTTYEHMAPAAFWALHAVIGFSGGLIAYLFGRTWGRILEARPIDRAER